MFNPDSLPRAGQLLALAVGLQAFFLLALFWRGILGKPQPAGGMRPRWLYVPLVCGTALGMWYGAMQSDLVFALAQGLALFLGVCALRTPRSATAQEKAPQAKPGGRKKGKPRG